MDAGHRLWFGPVAVLLLAAGTFAIGLVIPEYSHVRQTVSELGEAGSPGRVAFAALLVLVAACLALCATGVARALGKAGLSSLPAYFIGAMAISTAGVGIFAFPHDLHNVFGLSELVGYQAPLVAAWTGRRGRGARRIAMFSAAMYVAVLLAIVVNLAAMDTDGGVWALVRPVHGIAQRALFAAWFLWCAGYAVLLQRGHRRAHGPFDPDPLRKPA